MNRRSPLRYKIIREIRERIKAYEPEKVFLIGSYARGEADEVSDIDLVVIKDCRDAFFERAMHVLRVLNLSRAVDVLVYTPDEFARMLERSNAFAETVLEQGWVLYER